MNRFWIVANIVRSKLNRLNNKAFKTVVLNYLLDNCVSPYYIRNALANILPFSMGIEGEIQRFRRMCIFSAEFNQNYRFKKEVRDKFWKDHIDIIPREILIFALANDINENRSYELSNNILHHLPKIL